MEVAARSGIRLSPNQSSRPQANQAAIIALFRVVNRYVGNLPPISGVFPDYPAPVVRNTDRGTELIPMRWGIPPPLRAGGTPVTNIRNTSSPHWRGWLKPENRCLVPFNFAHCVIVGGRLLV
jgi:putative SOS response-associated peptidase YedK